MSFLIPLPLSLFTQFNSCLYTEGKSLCILDVRNNIQLWVDKEKEREEREGMERQ